jgi:hypothetical protein
MPSCPAPDGRRAYRQALRGDRRADLFLEPGGARGRLALVGLANLHLDAAPGADRCDGLLHVGGCAAALLVRRRPKVDGEAHVTGNDVGGTRTGFELADGADELRLAATPRFNREHAFGRGGERIAPQRHGHGARMSRHAFDVDGEAIGAVDRGDDAQRQAFGLEHRALLDVELGIGEEIGTAPRGVAGTRRIEPERCQCVAHRRAVLVAAVEKLGIQRAGDRAAAQQRGAEAHAFLVREAHDLERERQAVPRSFSAWTQSIAATTPSMPSYLPALRTVSRCEPSMRHGPPGCATFVAADDVADRVEPGAHSGFAHPPERELVRRALLRRQERRA